MDLLHVYEWIDINTILLFSLVFLLLSDSIKNKVPKNFPPGPWSLPIIGHLHHIDHKKIHLQLEKVICICIVYLQESDNLADRPKLPIFYDIFGDKGQPFDSHILLNNAVSNVICVLVFGHRFEYSDNDFQTLLKKIRDGVVFWGSIWAQLYNMFPWLMQQVPGRHKKIITLWQEVIDFIQGKVNAHRVDYDPSNPQDYIDCFLAEMEKPKDDTDAGFDLETLCFSILDLFIGGTETTSTTLCWGLLYMMKYPEIQAKVQEEIDRVVGGSGQPSLSDRDNMPYTNAVIHEIQRIWKYCPIKLGPVYCERNPDKKILHSKGHFE